MTTLRAQSRERHPTIVIVALGIAQILAWGTSFYFPAVFAGPIAAETGWSLGYIVSGTSIGLLVAGLVSPWVGRIIEQIVDSKRVQPIHLVEMDGHGVAYLCSPGNLPPSVPC